MGNYSEHRRKAKYQRWGFGERSLVARASEAGVEPESALGGYESDDSVL